MDDIMFSTPTNIATERAFIDNDRYDELAKQCKQEVNLYKVVLNTGTNSEDFESTMDEQLKQSIPGYENSFNITLNYSTMRMGTSVSALIFMGIRTVFVILLIMIAMIIINFNIHNSIEMNIKNIGILQATGYTRRQLIAATIIEILIIGTIGMAAGLIFARSIFSIIGGIVASSIGMLWDIGFDVVSAIYSILITFMMVLAAAYIGALKFRKINVLDALRNGIKNHNFKRSYVNLDKTSLPLNIALGIKNILSRKAKNIVIVLIIALLTYCSNAAIGMYQNFVQDNSNMLNITGFEVSAIGISFDKGSAFTKKDVDDVEKRIRILDGVKEIKQYTRCDMTCTSENGSESLSCDAYDDTNLKVDNIVNGRRPQDDDVTVTNFHDYILSTMTSITSIMKLFSYIIIAAVGLVIALMMMFLVKTQLVRDSRQYGIYKALGYTTGQLLLQTTMNYLPVAIVGTLIGCILSVFLMNPLYVA
jgi:putative ABC transport system permease protein